MTGRVCFSRALAALATWLTLAGPAAAQSMLTLTDAADTTLRGGTYANTNYGNSATLYTRASDNATYKRRALLKFDTHNTIPAGTTVTSAILALTIRGGDPETRSVGAYYEPSSYDEAAATWNVRKTSTSWSTPGGNVGALYDTETVTNVAGSKVSWDVTRLVQDVVSGRYGSSRYARMLLIDSGAASGDSYKEYYSEEAGGGRGPTLTVVFGGTSPPPAPTGTGVPLNVVEWNTHHGVGTDGKYDINRIATWIAKWTPDVVILNEAEKYTYWGNEDQPERYRDMLEAKTGKPWYYVFAQEYGNWNANGKGNLVLSTYPFVSTAMYEISYDRTIALAAINVNGRNVTIMSTHLDPDSSTRRYTQAKEIVAYAASFAENRIISGDFNAWPDQTSIGVMNGTYSDAWTQAQNVGQAYGYSPDAIDGQTKKGRIDYVFFSKGASNLVVTKAQVPDTRVSGYMPSDHRPVVVTFDVR